MDLLKELRQQGWKPDQIAAAACHGKPLVEAKKPHKLDKYRSKTEAAYSLVLGDELLAGEIVRFEYEAMKFKLADGAWFCPDFCVWVSLGHLELREIKGGFIREAARVRFLVAKRLYPEFVWRMVQKQGNLWVDIA